LGWFKAWTCLGLPLVAAERRQGFRDIFDEGLDPELLGQHSAEPKGIT
jgi:hypothetical protein